MFEGVKKENLRTHIFSQEQYLFSEREVRDRLLIHELHSVKWNNNLEDNFSFLTEAEKQALFDLQHYLKDDLLVKVDRASMRYGLDAEVRYLTMN